MSLRVLSDLLDRRAAVDPDRPAVAHGTDRSSDTWSYAELAAASRAGAARLHEAGVRRGDRVLILGAHRIETAAAIFAAARLGAMYVVVGDQVREFHLAHIVADAQPAAAIAPPDMASRVTAVTDVPVLPPPGPRDTDLPALPPTEAVVSADPVSLIYTSGSTAMPKAVVSTHRQVLFATDAIQSRLAYRPDDVVLCCPPLSFDYGLYQLFLACASGARLVLASAEEAGADLLGLLLRHRVTVLPVVPSLAVSLCRAMDRTGAHPSGLRLVTNSGAALPPAAATQLRRDVAGLALVSMFGLTECKRVSIGEPDEDVRWPGSCGRPLPHTEAYVVDESGRRLPPGEVGQLVVRGEHVMAGYWRAPELTSERFVPDEFGVRTLHTGDWCRFDEGGRLYFVGRHDDVYKHRGFRVSVAEVEAAAADIPGVEQAAVLAPRDGAGPRLVVTGAVEPEQVIVELGTRLEDYKVPGECQVRLSLPLNANGKVDKRVLAEMLDAHVRTP